MELDFPTNPTPKVDELFRLYPQLAGRVTDLRSILQNPEVITRENCNIWTEDVKSVMADFMTLADLTAHYLRSQLPLEPKDETHS